MLQTFKWNDGIGFVLNLLSNLETLEMGNVVIWCSEKGGKTEVHKIRNVRDTALLLR